MISEEQEKMLRVKELVRALEQSTIEGSAITMCLLPHKNMTEYTNMLASQIAQAGNIKDKSNRQSVVQGLKSARQAIKNYKKVPSNGLLVICANLMFPNKHAYQKVVEVIEPHKPITKQVYSCGKNFSFHHINEQILVNDQTFGFIVIDGNSALFAKVKGGHRQILKEVKSDIMRNHNKGGQSSVRFARLRDQSRFNFVKIACEQANKIFSNTSEDIQGYVIAGSANIKQDFVNSENLSPQIKSKIIKVIDIAQGSQEGLKMAISQSKEIITDALMLKERQILGEYFELANKNSEKVTNGLKAVAEIIQIGVAQKIICCKDKLTEQQIENVKTLCDANGCNLVLVSAKSEEGEYFARSYGGIGAILRYEFDSSYLKEDFIEEETGIEQDSDFFL